VSGSRYLLDSHVLLWAQIDSPRLSDTARSILQSSGNTLLWSAASTWELAIKSSKGRLEFPVPLDRYLARVIRELRLTPLAVEHSHAWTVAGLPKLHGDPFDRMLVAQAKLERVPLLTTDSSLAAYDIETVW